MSYEIISADGEGNQIASSQGIIELVQLASDHSPALASFLDSGRADTELAQKIIEEVKLTDSLGYVADLFQGEGPFILTNGIGEEEKPEAKFNEHHDDHGRFASSDGEGKEPIIHAPSQAQQDYQRLTGQFLPESTKTQFQEIANQLGKKNVYIAVTPTVLSKVLKDGEFKTQHETGKSNGYYDPNLRAGFEDRFFGDRPVYGYLSDDGQAGYVSMSYPDRGEPYLDDPVSQYGEARVLLNDDIKDRTSFLDGDSFDYNRQMFNQLATKVNSPGYQSVWPKGSESFYKELLDDKVRSHYVEAQVHGGLKASDIKSVVFYRKDPPKNLQNALNKAGISWERRDHIQKAK